MTLADIRPYPLDNDHPEAATQHEALAALLNPVSYEHTIEVVDLAGKRCLEVGAGGGSFANYLAKMVGPGGSVLATDIKPGRIPAHPNLTVVRHDITNDVIPGRFDFIHARLVLGHLPEREQILARLVQALNPDGTILVEDWDARETDIVLHAPSPEAAELYRVFQEALANRVLAASGTDRTWARRIHGAMLDEGLVDVQTVMHAEAWVGRTPGCQLVKATIAQLHDKLVLAGLTDRMLRQVRVLLHDPRLVLAGHLLYSTSGRRRPRSAEIPGDVVGVVADLDSGAGQAVADPVRGGEVAGSAGLGA